MVVFLVQKQTKWTEMEQQKVKPDLKNELLLIHARAVYQNSVNELTGIRSHPNYCGISNWKAFFDIIVNWFHVWRLVLSWYHSWYYFHPGQTKTENKDCLTLFKMIDWKS